MISVGLTGGIGSGKSTVAQIFQCLGIPVYNADFHAKKFLQHPEIIKSLAAKLGNSILDANNNIIKPKLAEIVFNDENALSFLNNLIHPLVVRDFNIWRANQEKLPYVIHEAALIFEAKLQQQFDKIILITASEEIKIKRVMQRDSATPEQIKQRMQKQWPDEEKMKLADYLIKNDESELVLPQIIRLHNAFLALNKSKTDSD